LSINSPQRWFFTQSCWYPNCWRVRNLSWGKYKVPYTKSDISLDWWQVSQSIFFFALFSLLAQH
jgi:hypothetical protein